MDPAALTPSLDLLERLGFCVVRHLGRVHSPLNTGTHVTVEVQLDGRTCAACTSWCPRIRRRGPFLHEVVVNRHTPEGHLGITGEHRVVRRAGQETGRTEIDADGVVAGVREAGVTLDDDAEAALRAHLASARKA